MRIVNAALHLLLWLVYLAGALLFVTAIALGEILAVWSVTQGGLIPIAGGVVLAFAFAWVAYAGSNALIQYWRWGPSEF